MHSLASLTAAFILSLAACASTGSSSNAGAGGDRSSTPTDASTPSLVGTWEDTRVSYGGLGMTMLFAPGGAVTFVAGAMVGGKYTLEGNQLTLLSDGPVATPPEVQTLSFAADTAVISVGTMIRGKLIPTEMPAQRNSLIGQWRYMHLTGVPAYEEYTSDGTMRLRVPIQVLKGRYYHRGNSLRIRILSPPTPERLVRFFLDGDTLTLRGDDGPHVFVRARPLLPYDIQQPRMPIR